MAATHVGTGSAATKPNLHLQKVLESIEFGYYGLKASIKTMESMIDGDGSDPSHFEMVKTKYAFSSTTVAQAAWLRLLDLYNKIHSDAPTSEVASAFDLTFANMR